METVIKIFTIAIVAMIAIGVVLYLIFMIVEVFRHAAKRFPGNGKSELHWRDRYEVANKITAERNINQLK